MIEYGMNWPAPGVQFLAASAAPAKKAASKDKTPVKSGAAKSPKASPLASPRAKSPASPLTSPRVPVMLFKEHNSLKEHRKTGKLITGDFEEARHEKALCSFEIIGNFKGTQSLVMDLTIDDRRRVGWP